MSAEGKIMPESAGQASTFLERVYAAAKAGSSSLFPVYNPATGSEIAAVADMGPAEAEAAIEAAKKAQKSWADQTAKARSDLLMAWHDLILDHSEQLAQLITLEMGKPLAEAKGEIAYGASYIAWFAEEGKRLYGDIIPTNNQARRLMVLKQAIGVVGAITPWNFPNAMITRKIAPALAAGCSIVLKPAEDTPLSAVALSLLAEDAGLPRGLINIVTSSEAPAIASVLTSHKDVRKISFTGSTRVGKLLARDSAATIKRLSLELGGNAPFIVFEDADIDAAVAGVLLSKYRNAGQTCVSANRIFVHSSCYETFSKRLVEAASKLVVGEGDKPGTQVGPMINAAAVTKVCGLIRGAVDEGCELALGGGLHSAGDNFIAPTVLTNANTGMAIAQTEIFGPVAVLYRFDSEEDVIRMANDTNYGLAAYCYTKDMGRVLRLSEGLEFGMVGINEGSISSEAAPFGGVKESGVGREGSRYGLDDYTEIKYVGLTFAA